MTRTPAMPTAKRGGAAVCLLLGLHAIPVSNEAGVIRKLTDEKPVLASFGDGALDDAGTVVYANSNVGLGGGDPLLVQEIVELDAVTGDGTQVSDLAVSRYPATAASDDGQWLAFESGSDPLGQNADGSDELFVMRPDGSGLAQLTDSPDGRIAHLAFAGSGNRIAFVADLDPFGTNPSRHDQLFVVDRDGTGLAQLTSATADDSIWTLSISDDGQRIAFDHSGDPAGGNPDGSPEVFVVQADGTGLRQLTASLGYESSDPFLSGNGAKVVFSSYANLTGANPFNVSQIFIIDWNGTGLRQLTAPPDFYLTYSESPVITDDGLLVFFSSDPNLPLGNREIWRINADGTGKAQLTETTHRWGNSDPVVSGGGSTVVFRTWGPFPGGLNEDGCTALMAMDPDGGNVRVLLEEEWSYDGETDITADGTRIAYYSNNNDFGGNPDRRNQIFRVESDGSGAAQITSLTDGDVWQVGIADDRSTIAFSRAVDGSNLPDVFTIQADGTGLVDLTPDDSSADYPAIAGNGSYVVFQSSGDFTGGNSDGSDEIFSVRPDGTGMLQSTSDDDARIKVPRVSANGEWIVFQSGTNVLGGNDDGRWEIYRVRTDGTGFERLTGDPDYSSYWPDVSASGERIVYLSQADPLGTNADHNYEVFLVEPGTDATRQLTVTTEGNSDRPRITDDGAYVFFGSSSPFFGETVGLEPYRLEVDTGVLERAGGLGARVPGANFDIDWSVVPDADGDRAVFAASGNADGGNPDRSDEVWLVDFSAPARIRVSKTSPTVVSWDAEPQPVRYDVIRGDVSDLRIVGDEIDLGEVVCLEDDSTDTDTGGFEDPADPAPGEAFFFLHRGTQGPTDGPGSYGQDTGGRERVAGSGDCNP